MSRKDSALLSNSKISYPLQLVLLSFLYLITGKIALQFAISPGYATYIWPPSGIAVAMLLLFGYRLWPGIMLGALILEFSIDSASLVENLPAALIIISGSVLQAVVCAALFNRHLKNKIELVKLTEIIIFFFLVVATSSIISSTVGVSVLAGTGLITWNEIGLNWLIWWLGDAAGVSLVSPIMFCFLAKPEHIWRKRIKTFLFPISLALIANFILFQFFAKFEADKVDDTIQKEINQMQLILMEDKVKHLEVLSFLSDFYASSNHVDHNEFLSFTKRFFESGTTTRGISWLPRIALKDRQAFEQQVTGEEGSEYYIKDIGREENLVRAGSREFYYPIYYTSPYKGPRRAWGADIGSEKTRLEAIEKARDVGDIVISKPIQLLSDERVIPSILIFQPIYLNGKSTQTVKQRRENLHGFVVGVYHINEIFNMIYEKNPLFSNYRMVIVDVTNPEEEVFIYDSMTPYIELSDGYSADIKDAVINNYVKHQNIPIGSTVWKFYFIPNESYLKSLSEWQVQLIKLFMVLGTVVFAFFLLMVTGRTNEIEELIKERTNELAKLNKDLEKIIHDQYETENSLRISQESFRTLVQNIPGVVYRCANNVEMPYEFLSENFGEYTGFSSNEEVRSKISKFKIIFKEDRELVTEKIINSVDNGLPYDLEYRIKTKEGSVRWVHDKGQGFKTAQGNIKWIDGAFFDITEQKNVIEQISQEKTRLERFQRLTVDREKKMLDLKKEINDLYLSLNKEAKYRLKDGRDKNLNSENKFNY